MGNNASSSDVHKSNKNNDYNPFNIPKIPLDDPSAFTQDVALRGAPPLHSYTKSRFSKFTMEEKAAYADGVVRGNYHRDWLKKQFSSSNDWEMVNCSSLGGLAYFILKCEENGENMDYFRQIINNWIEKHTEDQDRF